MICILVKEGSSVNKTDSGYFIKMISLIKMAISNKAP